MATKEEMKSIGKFPNPSNSLSVLRRVWGKKLEERPFGSDNNVVECFVPRRDYEKPIKPRKEKVVPA